jgi:hypothetical protein
MQFLRRLRRANEALDKVSGLHLPIFSRALLIAHLCQILVMVEGEACHFCDACGAHKAIFVPPAACKRRPRQGKRSLSAHFFSCSL